MTNTNLFKKIFRVEAFVLLAVIIALVSLYLYFFLESHVKWTIEKSAYESIGSEVNIDSVNIDFLKAEIEINRIQVTNPEMPEENFIELKSLSSSFEYAPLLQGAFISDLAKIKNIEFHTKRKRPGRVMPKEKRVLVFKDPTQNKVNDVLKNKFKKTAFSDLTSLFSSDKRKEIEEKYKKSLESLKASDEIKKETKAIEAQIDQFKAYAESDKVKSLLKNVKNFKFDSSSTSNSFKSTKEVLSLVKSLKKERSKFKNDLSAIKSNSVSLKNKVKASPKMFLKDFKSVSSSLSLSQLSPDKITEDVLSEYFSVQLNQVARATNSIKHKALGSSGKYVDLSGGGKKPSSGESSEDKADTNQFNLEKEKEKKYSSVGRDFIFYKGTVYPKYWFKKIEIDSKSNENQEIGDVKGLITNFSDAPNLIGKEMVVDIKGSAPKQGVGSFKIDAKIDHRNSLKKTEKISINVSDYIVKGLELFKASGDMIKVAKANSLTNLDISLSGGLIDLSLNQKLKAPSYDMFSKDKNILLLFNKIKESREELSFTLRASGAPTSPKIRLRSNFGDIVLRAVKESASSKVSDLASEKLSKLNAKALEKLSPILKRLDIVSLESDDLKKTLEKKVKEGLDKVQSQKSSAGKDKKKELLKKLFDKL